MLEVKTMNRSQSKSFLHQKCDAPKETCLRTVAEAAEGILVLMYFPDRSYNVPREVP